ncbi:MAG: cell division protein FtsZ [Paracoccaceae bacterium]
MTLNFIATEKKDLTPRITVFGVGGAGGNAVNNMIDKALEGVEFVVANTDAQALQQSKARARIQLGVKVTEGLGAGARPSVGASAAEETLEEIIDHLAGAHMCFITAGMGGGTGTGAAPIIAQAARELGVLTVGVVTKPFAFEGSKRMRQAEEGVEELQKVVDTLIIIPNQNLFRLANERTTFTEAFAMADDVLYQGVKGVTDLMVRPGMINLDFADVRAVMDEMGKAMMGTGEAEGDDRARQAAEKAIANPLLDEISLNGARGVLINVTGGADLTLYELDEAANLIREKVDAEANIIVGSTLDPNMTGAIRVSVVATGIEAAADAQTLDVPRRRLAEPLAHHQPVAAEPAPVETYEEPVAYEEAPVYAPEPARAEARYEPRAEFRAEPRAEARPEPRVEFRAEPRREYRAPAAPAYRPEVDRAPVQDEFNLDEVLADDPNVNARPTIVLTQPVQQPQYAPQHAAQHHAPQHQAAAMSRQAGQPSPETMARLRAAVEKRPEAQPAPRPEMQHRPEQQYRAEPAPAPQQPERSRFGALGGLIHRMAGSNEAPAAPAPQAQRMQPRMAAPQPSAYDDEPQAHPSQDRIEIPAFLRRQAN